MSKQERWYTVDKDTDRVFIHDEPTVGQSKSMTIIDMDRDGKYTDQLKYYQNTFHLRRAWDSR